MNRRPRDGRTLAALLADDGHPLPVAPPIPDAAPVRRMFDRRVSHRGVRQPHRGWAPSRLPASVWRMTSDQAPALWPFIAGPGLPPTGVQLGVDYFSGGSFYADPV